MTAPKFSVVGDKESEPVVPPVPARFTVVVVALLVTLMLPVTAPAALGPNFVVKVMLCPAFNVSGKFNPEKLNAAPLNDADISFTLVPRPFLIVTSCVALLPTGTVPKLTAVGVADKLPPLPPLPVTRTASPIQDLSFSTRIVPSTDEADAGLNNTVIDFVAPAARMWGNAGLVT